MQKVKPFNIVLVEPEIPPNTGTIARLCGATDTVLHLVRPLGFSTDDKHLKRAGLDYWKFVNIVYWDSFAQFLTATEENLLYFFTTKTAQIYSEVEYPSGAYLVFGKETKGLPKEILQGHRDRCCTLPMSNPHIRSLNLAVSAGIVLYEALRQRGFDRQ
ncbi:tRNA (cytidine(34)-2'-O)-methyltransferase [Desulforhopalus vacuolatus]|uniref:tRNA (cytidine(34)-2'-O)-methyltransferase n=1 Tax=Desulforhopalus vacuolatus TaxID=40414 RepID=UPI0019650EB8|nr:tRNA (cytidine(34)-2'-O)-methyltransferase [Desulforhopalus vacuolatus]MBM9519624.1 tRNA (cytidine(34)-2'-O)-methyltransferase [Desulforhopalus vacuolatus]